MQIILNSSACSVELVFPHKPRVFADHLPAISSSSGCSQCSTRVIDSLHAAKVVRTFHLVLGISCAESIVQACLQKEVEQGDNVLPRRAQGQDSRTQRQTIETFFRITLKEHCFLTPINPVIELGNIVLRRTQSRSTILNQTCHLYSMTAC